LTRMVFLRKIGSSSLDNYEIIVQTEIFDENR
jgi:hypothetical protein